MSPHLEKKSGGYIFDDAYELVCTLGRGSDSIIYKARPLATLSIEAAATRGTTYIPRLPIAAAAQEFVAVKILTNTVKNPAKAIQRTEKEAAALAYSSSKNVIQLIDRVSSEDLCYIVMEYAPYGNLHELLKKYSQPLPPERALKLLLQLLEGLQSIHDSGILHRDIKPDNLLVTDRQTIKISDFSVALLPEEREQDNGIAEAVGTLDYAAPELLTSGSGNESSDCYSAAVTCFELITRALPFSGESLTEQLNRKLTGVRTQLDRFVDYDTSDLEPFFDKALAPNPQDRFQSATEMLGAVQVLLARKIHLRKRFTSIPTTRGPLQNLGVSVVSLDPREEIEELQRRTRAGRLQLLRQSPIQQVSEVTPHNRTAGATRAQRRTKWAVTGSVLGLLLAVGFGTSIFGQSERAVASLVSPSLSDAHMPKRSLWDGITDIFQSQVEPFSVARSLTQGTHAGVLKGFLADRRDTSILVQGLGNGNSFVFTLGVPGWTPQKIVLSPESTSKEILIVGHGMSVSLWLNPAALSEGKLSGTYREHASGREGVWELKRTSR